MFVNFRRKGAAWSSILLASAIMLIAPVLRMQQSAVFGAELWLPIYDGRTDKREAKISKAEVRMVRNKVIARAQKFWSSDAQNPPEFKIQDVATGSFTRKGAVQQAYLYQYSSLGHNIANDGVAIFQGEKLVAHFAYRGGWEYGIVNLPDLNSDGLNELLIVGGSTNQGETDGRICIYGFEKTHVKGYGSFQVFDTADDLKGKAKFTTAYIISAKVGKSSQFRSVKYSSEHGKWHPAGKMTIAKPGDSFKLVDLSSKTVYDDVSNDR